MIKKGDYLYCHSDCYHNESKFLYDTDTRLVFKAGEKYLVEDVSIFKAMEPFFAMYDETGGLFLISLNGNDKCQHRQRFYTLTELRAKKLSEIFD